MVEGPGVRLSKERLSMVQGDTVQKVSGKQAQCAAILRGRQVLRVDCLGKELFILLVWHGEGDSSAAECLRVHFGMDGSARLHTASASAPAAEPWKSLEAEVIFESGRTLQFFGCTLSRRRQAEVEASVSAMRSLDVSVSEGFDAIRAAGIIGQQGDRPLCDVLLDQSILPGVGNIIKNEALLDARLRPATKAGELSPAMCQRLARASRAFTLRFYDCRKRGRSLKPFCRIYEMDACGKCGGRVVRTRMGENSRMTFYCPECQPETPSEAVPARTVNAALMDGQRPPEPPPSSSSLELQQHRCACGRPCVKKVTRRPGPNQGRPFLACSKSPGCGVFVWADRKFPKCRCKGSAGKPAVVRRVLKEGPNNGRHFYACPATKKVIGGGSIPNPLCRPPVTVNIRSVN